MRDVSERKAHTEALSHQALHDGLTGLANRTLFTEHVAQALASAARNHESRAILVMDLDGFKWVNDSLGHDQGDRLLKQFSDRLVAATREADTIARLGGDEFAILPGDAADLPAAAAIVWKLQHVCASGFQLDGQVVEVSASIGIAMFPEHGDTPAELLRRADVAMYHAKRSGSGHAVADNAQEEQATRQLELLLELRKCVSRNELILHYQPKIELGTGVICGVEALVRWQHPDQGSAAAGDVHGRRGAHRIARSADPVGAQRGSAPTAGVGRRRHRSDDGGQRLRAQPHRAKHAARQPRAGATRRGIPSPTV